MVLVIICRYGILPSKTKYRLLGKSYFDLQLHCFLYQPYQGLLFFILLPLNCVLALMRKIGFPIKVERHLSLLVGRDLNHLRQKIHPVHTPEELRFTRTFKNKGRRTKGSCLVNGLGIFT